MLCARPPHIYSQFRVGPGAGTGPGYAKIGGKSGGPVHAPSLRMHAHDGRKVDAEDT